MRSPQNLVLARRSPKLSRNLENPGNGKIWFCEHCSNLALFCPCLGVKLANFLGSRLGAAPMGLPWGAVTINGSQGALRDFRSPIGQARWAAGMTGSELDGIF